jgi:hypothetical protein
MAQAPLRHDSLLLHQRPHTRVSPVWFLSLQLGDPQWKGSHSSTLGEQPAVFVKARGRS